MPYVSDLQAAELTFGPEMLATLALFLHVDQPTAPRRLQDCLGAREIFFCLKLKRLKSLVY